MEKQQVYEITHPPRVVLKKGANLVLLHHSEIQWIEANGLYTVFHSNDADYCVRQTLGSVDQCISQDQFIRIHRSAIVNIECVRELRSWVGGDYKVVLKNGTELTCGRTYKDRLKKRIDAPVNAPQMDTHFSPLPGRIIQLVEKC